MTPENNGADQVLDSHRSARCCLNDRRDITDEHIQSPEGNTGSADDNIGDNALRRVPTDQGWAWVVCAACFVITFIMSLYEQVLAVMFVEVVEKFEVSVVTAALVFTIQSFTFSAGSVVSTNIIVPKFGDRLVIVIAAVINSASTLVIGFSPNVAFYLTFHLFKGFSVGSMWIPALGLLGHYFKRRRSLATAMTNSGIGVALLVAPPFVRLLLDTFGFQGALLIVSGIEMQAIAMGMLLRPPNVYAGNLSKRSSDLHNFQAKLNENESLLYKREAQDRLNSGVVALTQIIVSSDQEQLKCGVHPLSVADNSCSMLQCEEQIHQDSVISDDDHFIDTDLKEIDVPVEDNSKEIVISSSTFNNQNLEEQESTLLLNRLNIHNNKCPETRRCQCGNNPAKESVCSAAQINQTQLETTEKQSLRHNSHGVWWLYPCEVLSSIFDFKLLSDWLMRLLLASTALGALLQYIPAYIPTLAVQKGVAKKSAAILLTVCGGVNLFSTLIQGFFIDCRVITAAKFIIVCQFIVGTMCHLTHFFTSFPTLLLLSITFGMFGGARLSLMPIVAMDFVGVANLSKALGFNAMVATLSLSLHHPFLGYLLDTTGSFAVPYHYVGFALYISAGFMLLEKVGRNLNNRRKAMVNNETKSF